MAGKKYQDFLPHIIQTSIGNNQIPHLDSIALIELKKTSWREKDQLDVAALKKQMRVSKKTSP
jgi:hypothetical protein